MRWKFKKNLDRTLSPLCLNVLLSTTEHQKISPFVILNEIYKNKILRKAAPVIQKGSDP